MAHTYILYSSSLDLLYRGSTSNLKRRFHDHNEGLSAYTKPGIPWILLWKTEKRTKVEAFRLEKKLKNLSRQRLIEFMLKHEEGVAGPDEATLLLRLSGL